MARAADFRDILETGVVLFPGSVDKLRNPLLFVRLELICFLEKTSSNELKAFLNYFITISKEEVRQNGFAFLIDCTKGNPTNLPDILDIIHDYFSATVSKIYIIQKPSDEGILGRAYVRMKSLLSNMQGNTEFPTQTLNGYSDIPRVIDVAQIPTIFEGDLDFDHKFWVETRIELEKLLRDNELNLSLISANQETLIRPIPSNISELISFEKSIELLRSTIYLPAQCICSKTSALMEEIVLARSGSPGSSRFRHCPLSIIHKIDSKLLQSTHDRLLEVSDNFLNLWGLQLQKTYLEKFILSSELIIEKLTDLESTVCKPVQLTLSNVESQYHFYSSIQTTLLAEDNKYYENCVSSHTRLRDWTYTEKLPTDDLTPQTTELINFWVRITTIINGRKKSFGYYNDLKQKTTTLLKNGDIFIHKLERIKVSEEISENIALPIRHHTLTDYLKSLNGQITADLGDVVITKDLVLDNVDVAQFNKVVRKILDRSLTLSNLNNQCLAIKEQVSLFFSCIKDIKDWIEHVGHLFISTQTLGSSLEESKQGKTKFLKFITNSGLDGTKQKLTQCSKTLSVVLNSLFLEDQCVNIIRDTFNRTEQDWKRFGLEVQEHGRDLELSIEFYEAAESVNSWLKREKDNSRTLIKAPHDKPIEETMGQLNKFKQDMRQTSNIMDVCHSKYIALSASSNSTLRHIRHTKTKVDTDWSKFSEKIRVAEKEIEKRYKARKPLSEPESESKASSDQDSVASLDLDAETDHVAFRNTKMLLQELVNTERTYVEDLKDIVTGYKTKIETSPICPGHVKKNVHVIFGNIEEIYNFHGKIFFDELKNGVERVGAVFCNNNANFDNMYAAYCQNKPHSENFLSVTDDAFLVQCQKDLNHALDLSSYLLKPVQRIMKYHLILEKLLKYTPDTSFKSRAQLEEALKIMERVPRYANDVIHLMGLEGYSGNFESLGQLLLQEQFQVYVNGQRKPISRQIFIFEHALLFSKPTLRPNSRKVALSPKYQFKNEILLQEIGPPQHVREDVNQLQFQIEVFKKGPKGEFYVFEARSTNVRDQWIEKIVDRLSVQFNNMKNRAASNVL